MSVDEGYFNVGTDHSLTIQNAATGASVSLDGRRTNFTHEAKDKVETSEPVDLGGLVDHRVMPGGWSGTISVDRNNAQFALLFAFLESNIYSGGTQTFFTITSYEPNADQSATQAFQYQKVVFHGYKPGNWARETVKPEVMWEAQQRIAL